MSARPIELKDQLSVSRRGLITAVVATIAVAILAALVAFPARTVYRTVAVVSSDPNATSANERQDFVADMQAAVFQPSVIAAISNDTGVPAVEIRNGLQVGRLRDSTLLEVQFVTEDDDAEAARQVVTLAPTKATQFLRRDDVERAEAAVERAERDLEAARRDESEADAAVSRLVTANDLIPPDESLRALREQIADLEVAAAALPSGDPSRTQLLAQVQALRGRVGAAMEQADEYAALVAARDEAAARRARIEGQLATARANLVTAGAVPSVSIELVAVPSSGARAAALQVFAAAAATLIGTVLTLSWWERRRSASVAQAVADSRREAGARQPDERPDQAEVTLGEKEAERWRGKRTSGRRSVG